jgi:formate hydrogenlyase subunit 3/multisubunit Na+/H+ antiporter MnhD subunit
MLAFAAILVPLGAGALGLVAWRSPRTQVAIAVAGSVLHVAVAGALLAAVSRHGIVAVQVGGWPAPFGISLVADTLGALLATLTAVVGLACGASAPDAAAPGRSPSCRSSSRACPAPSSRATSSTSTSGSR